jgi:hypothetical protein
LNAYALRSCCTVERGRIRMPCLDERCECIALCKSIEFSCAAIRGCTCCIECEEGKQRRSSDWVEPGPETRQHLSISLYFLSLPIRWELSDCLPWSSSGIPSLGIVCKDCTLIFWPCPKDLECNRCSFYASSRHDI